MAKEPLLRFLERFPHAKRGANGWYEDKCPAHDDRHASFGFHEQPDGAVVVKCQAGCMRGAILKAIGLESRDCFPLPGSNGHKENGPRIKAMYDYVDAKGKPLFQVVRMDPKGFWQRRPDGLGGWIKDMRGVKRVLYHLPEVLSAKSSGVTVWITEGERDADCLRALGLTATTNAGGAGKWQDTYTNACAGCHVAILPDNDEPGRQHAEMVSASLRGKAASVRVIELPGLGEKGDVSDWIGAGGTRKDLEALLKATDDVKVPSAPASGYTYDDIGNAKRLVARHGDDIRHCSLWEKWLVWDGRRWAPDETSAIMRHAIETAESILAEVKMASDYSKAMEHAKRSRGAGSLSAMIRLAEAFSGVAVLPSHFDQNPWLLNCLNGTVDLRTGELKPHERADAITKLAPVDYDPNAKHSLWDDLLKKVTGGNQEVLSYLQRAAGYSLTGSTQEEKVFVLVSDGGGGKTSFLEAMSAAMGEYATAAEQGTFMARSASGGGHSEDIAALVGSRLVLATEVGKGRLAEELLKRMTGGDTMRASRKHGHSFSFQPSFTLWLAANSAPGADDTDTGIWRRLRRIPWTPIEAKERDPAAKDKLRRPEECGSAILAWMVAGCLAWQRDGLGDAPSIVEATESYRQESDPFSSFVSQMCILGDWQWVRAKDLRSAYEQWCREEGYKPMGGKDWGSRLEAYGFKGSNSRAIAEDGKPKGRFWDGIGLIGDPANAENDTPATGNLLQLTYHSSLYSREEYTEKDVAACCNVAEEEENTEPVDPDGSFYDE